MRQQAVWVCVWVRTLNIEGLVHDRLRMIVFKAADHSQSLCLVPGNHMHFVININAVIVVPDFPIVSFEQESWLIQVS